MMVLYHGSKDVVEHPVYGIGKRTNDYGQGFYCTEDPELAKEWACGYPSDGYCNMYQFDESNMNILDLDSEGYGLMHWITILIENRTFDISSDISKAAMGFLTEHYHIDLEGYDCISGYRADDSYFRFAQDFLEGGLTVDRLSKAIRLGNLGKQFMIRSPEAFGRLVFKGYTICNHGQYHTSRLNREESARSEYKRIRSEPFDPNEITILDLIRGTVSADDPRLS